MARELNKYDIMAHEADCRGKPLDWFEKVYSGAKTGDIKVPWGYQIANPYLVAWLNDGGLLNGQGKSALKIGCGLGDDAEELSGRGFGTTAFDIAPSAITLASERFPNSQVEYVVADLFKFPPMWKAAFDVVVEIFTIQSLPLRLRPVAYKKIASFLKPGGSLFVVCFGRSGVDDQGRSKLVPQPLRMPWPLTREELSNFRAAGLKEVSFAEEVDPDNEKVRRFIAEYTKP